MFLRRNNGDLRVFGQPPRWRGIGGNEDATDPRGEHVHRPQGVLQGDPQGDPLGDSTHEMIHKMISQVMAR